MKNKLIIWGAAGHALVVADILKLADEHTIAGFIDDINPVPAGANIHGLPVYGGRGCLPNLMKEGVTQVIFAFGDCQGRLQLAEWARTMNLAIAKAIHPRSIVAEDVTIGDGTVIAAGAVVNPGAIIGENVIINTCASVDHECVIGDGTHVCPGAHLAGRVQIGRATWIGIGACVVDRVRIGAGSMIGAGSVVTRDIPDGVLAYGAPAKIIRKL